MAGKKTKKKARPKKVLGNRSATTSTSANMSARGKAIAKVATQSPLWKDTIKQTGTDAIAACAQIEADDAKIVELELQLGAARNAKVDDEVVCASKFGLYVTAVEDGVTTPKEMQGLGIDPLAESAYSIGAPLGVTATSDPALHDISVRVKRSPGMHRCVIEVSSDPTMATGVKTFPGDGVRQTMGPFPPGTYAVRACHTRASERSAYCEIVTVVVK